MNRNITIGQIDLSFHKAAAAVYHLVLSYLGYSVELVTAPHAQMFALQEAGKIDLLVSAWLPGSHAKYLEPYRQQATLLPAIYEPFCIWGVPSYIPQELANSVNDLTKPPIAARLCKTIDGIGSGAGISRFSVEIIEHYQLDKLGFKFVNHTEPEFFKIIESKFRQNSWFVIPLWHPQYLLRRFDIRALEEPNGLLRGRDEARPVLSNSFAKNADTKIIRLLGNIYLGNEVETELDYQINIMGLTPAEAAANWIDKAYGNISQYVGHLSR